jgi:hypothetical protein
MVAIILPWGMWEYPDWQTSSGCIVSIHSYRKCVSMWWESVIRVTAQEYWSRHCQTAAREATALTWQEVAVDLVGGWTIPVNGMTFMELTIIGTVTNLLEVIRLHKNKTYALILPCSLKTI